MLLVSQGLPPRAQRDFVTHRKNLPTARGGARCPAPHAILFCMMLPLLFSVLATAHSHAASPDTFWVLPANSQKDTQAEPIRGALIDEDATHFHVRVEGGELWIEKKLVQRVEKDALTVEEIAKKEQEKRAIKPEPTPEAKTAEAATRPAEAAPAEATAPAVEPASDAAPAAEPQQRAEEQPRFDPVLGRMTGTRAAEAAQRIAELREAYRATRSQETRKELRRARRGL